MVAQLLSSSCNPTSKEQEVTRVTRFCNNSDKQSHEEGEFCCFASSQCFPWRWTYDREEDCLVLYGNVTGWTTVGMEVMMRGAGQ